MLLPFQGAEWWAYGCTQSVSLGYALMAPSGRAIGLGVFLRQIF